LATLGGYKTQAACEIARDVVQSQLKNAIDTPQVTCLSAADLDPLSKAMIAGSLNHKSN
jgi:hypothetical protein